MRYDSYVCRDNSVLIANMPIGDEDETMDDQTQERTLDLSFPFELFFLKNALLQLQHTVAVNVNSEVYTSFS